MKIMTYSNFYYLVGNILGNKFLIFTIVHLPSASTYFFYVDTAELFPLVDMRGASCARATLYLRSRFKVHSGQPVGRSSQVTVCCANYY